jgi:hypothetical protein
LKAIVEKDKIVEYLLNTQHPDGASKAYFFRKLGFHQNEPQVLEKALLDHYSLFESSSLAILNEFGVKYVIKGPLETPSNNSVLIKSVWFRGNNADFCKLVTAYPF